MKNYIHTFPKDIQAKVNIIARREFELAAFESALQIWRHGVSLLQNKSYYVFKKNQNFMFNG